MCETQVLRRAETHRRLLKTIRLRQMQFLGHVVRKEGLEELLLTGCIERKEAEAEEDNNTSKASGSGLSNISLGHPTLY